MRTAPKLVGLICGVALSAASVCQSSADTLLLTGASPAATVNLYGSALPSGYGTASQAVDAYAGVLDWTDTSSGPNNGATYYTYCIDVASIIYQNQSYCYGNPAPLTSGGSLGFSTQQVNAIYTLWTDPFFKDAGNLSSAASVSAISQTSAGEFQVALWDILYNVDSTNNTLDGTALNFVQNESNLSSGDLSCALAEANYDYSHANSSALANPGVDALLTTSGQNQAIYVGGVGPFVTAAPLPGSFAAGLILLLGLAGVGSASRFRTNRIKSAV